MTVERRYRMTRLDAGDYLLPSNDGRILWRIVRYTEDGTAERQDGTRIRGPRWALWRWRHTPGEASRQSLLAAIADPDAWEFVGDMLSTRQDAIDTALRSAPNTR